MYLKLDVTYKQNPNYDLHLLAGEFVQNYNSRDLKKGSVVLGGCDIDLTKGLNNFPLYISLHTRHDIKDYLVVSDDVIELFVFNDLFGETLVLDKETLTGKLGETITFKLSNCDTDYKDFSFLSNHFGWHQTLKPYETYDDLLRRIPLELQLDVFTSTISGLTYFDIEDIYKANLGLDGFSLLRSSETIYSLEEHLSFMGEMEMREDIDMDSVKKYFQHRLDSSFYLNSICKKEVKNPDFDFNTLHAPKEEIQ